MNLAEFSEIQALSVREKLELVDEIWKSTSPEADLLDVSAGEKLLLDVRRADFLAAPDSALSIEQFDERLRRLRA